MKRYREMAICIGLLAALVLAYWVNGLLSQIIGDDTNDSATY